MVKLILDKHGFEKTKN